MPEIKLNKRLPNLSPEEEQIFTEAINEAYLRGKEDGKPKWIPVTERLPEYGQLVIVYSGGVLSPQVFAQHFWRADFNDWAHITHWMPLPEPPKGE